MEVGIILLTGSNVITLDTFDKLWNIFDDVTLITVDDLTYNDICALGATGQCTSFGPLQFWSQNRTLYDMSVTTVSDLQAQISVANFPDGSFVNRESLFGDYVVDSGNTLLTAKGLSLTVGVSRGSEDQQYRWAEKFLNYMDGVNYNSEPVVNYLSGRSIDDELGRSVTGDVTLMVITYVLMLVFSCCVLSKKINGIESRFGLASCGVGIILLAIVAGYGFCSGLGVGFNSLHQVLPFIVVGIGVDDILIMVASFDQTDASLPVEERLVAAMRSCGLGITYTTATDVVAFLIGSSSALPAIQAFCLYAAFTLLFNFAFQITMFIALFYWDAKRMEEGRLDVLGCAVGVVAKSVSTEEAMETVGGEINDNNSNEPPGKKIDSGDSVLRKFMHDVYAPALTKTSVRIVVFVTFGILTIFGAWGTAMGSIGFEMTDLLPDDSYAREYVLTARSMGLFVFESNVPVGIYFKENVDYSNQQVQMSMIDAEVDFLDYRFNFGPVSSWIEDFNNWLPTSAYSGDANVNGYLTNSTLFTSAVYDFVQDPEYVFYNEHIIFGYETISGAQVPVKILTSRIMGYHSQQESTLDEIHTMEYTRHMAANIDVRPSAFAFSGQYLFVEAESLIVGEMVLNLILALSAVFVITLLVLVRPTAVLLSCCVLIIIDIDIIGTMYAWDLTISTITVVQMVMAVGLVVDYISHILHYYLKQLHSLSPDDRMIAAMTEIGPSVLLGCSTTFIGILPLGFANSTIFRTFFRMFLSIIVYGAIHGLVLLPALLPLIPFDDVRVYFHVENQHVSLDKQEAVPLEEEKGAETEIELEVMNTEQDVIAL